MADVDRRYPYANGYDGRYEKEYRYGNGFGTEYYNGGTNDKSVVGYNNRGTNDKSVVGYNNRTDYDQSDRSAVVPYNPGVYRTYNLRSQYGSGEPKRLEVVKGNVFSVNQIFVTPPRETTYRPPLALPGPKDESSKTRSTWFSDPEMKRKRRVASYKAYSVEGKVKASLKKSFRWIRYKCSELIHGW